MPTLTPEEINEILSQFFDVVGKRQYIGARYVPVFGRKDETSIQWDNTKPYEPLTIVLYQGNSFTSRTYVPIGVDINNTVYWANTGNYNAQVEQYRREVLDYRDYFKQKPFAFDNVDYMQRSTELYVGAICHTNGFHSSNDGGAAWYVISDTGNTNGRDILACTNSLYATLIVTEPFVTPEMFGAYKDGTRDDSAAIIRAMEYINNNGTIYFNAGTYVCSGIPLTGNIEFKLDVDAVIKAANTLTDNCLMRSISGFKSFVLEGGTIDFNEFHSEPDTATGYGFALHIPHGTSFILKNCHLDNIFNYGAYVNNFGGYVEMSHCLVTNQRHPTETRDGSSLLHVIGGESGYKGLVRFNHNRCIGPDVATNESGPGGVFLCCRDDENDLTHGNGSTAEFIGNYFYGYGLYHGVNIISPIHFYPQWDGVRIVGNYFEKSYAPAMSLKSVKDCIVTDNIIYNSGWTTTNVNTEGCIAYAPTYHAGDNERLRAVIANNCIKSGGGVPDTNGQAGISVLGTGNSYGGNIIVADNTIEDCGIGIRVDYVASLLISENVVRNCRNSAIELYHIGADVRVASNIIRATRASGITCSAPNPNGEITVSDNNISFEGDAPYASAAYGINIRGAKIVRVYSNSINTPTVITNIGNIHLSSYETYVADFLEFRDNVLLEKTGFTVNPAVPARVAGQLEMSGSPLGIVTPATKGVIIIDITNNNIYMSTGTTVNSWVQLN